MKAAAAFLALAVMVPAMTSCGESPEARDEREKQEREELIALQKKRNLSLFKSCLANLILSNCQRVDSSLLSSSEQEELAEKLELIAAQLSKLEKQYRASKTEETKSKILALDPTYFEREREKKIAMRREYLRVAKQNEAEARKKYEDAGSGFNEFLKPYDDAQDARRVAQILVDNPDKSFDWAIEEDAYQSAQADKMLAAKYERESLVTARIMMATLKENRNRREYETNRTLPKDLRKYHKARPLTDAEFSAEMSYYLN